MNARLCGFSLFALMRYLREEILITAGTASSEAVLAPVMLKLEQLGCEEAIVGMVVPAGYTFNATGTAIYLSMGAIFIAQATNTYLSLREQIVILVVLMLTSKGSAGVAGAGFVTLAATLAAMHTIPVAGLVLLLGVERITNVARAVVNVIGSAVATIVVAKWEGEFDSADMKLIHSVGGQVAVFLANNMLYADLQDLLMGVLHALTASIDAKDPYTCGHSERVAMLSRLLAQQIGLGPETVQQVYLSGLCNQSFLWLQY